MRQMSLPRLRAVYWIVTVLFVLPQAWAAFQYLLEAPRMAATISDLGYPTYFMKILGAAKLLGIAAILTGLSAGLKEWAYAGFTFDVCGAFASHVSVGDPAWVALVPLAFLVVQLTSYAMWKRINSHQAARRRRYLPSERPRQLAEGHA